MGIDLLTIPEVQTAIKNRIKAKSLETQAKLLKKEADGVLICHMVCNDEKLIKHSEGTFNYVAPGVSKTLDKKKLKEALVDKGVPVTVITESFEESTTEKEKAEYITFKEKQIT